MCIATSAERLCAQLSFSRISIKIAVAVSTAVLVLLQVVFMVWEIVLVISAW